MRKRYLFASGLVLLAILLTLVVWQVSFNFGEYGPANAAQTFVFWAVSTLIFLLTVTLGFMLFRDVKLYLERQRNREGSRIKSKLVLGALALSLLPVAFLVLFSYGVLNRTWTSGSARPAEGINIQLRGVAAGRRGADRGRRRWPTGSRYCRKCGRNRGLRQTLPRKPHRRAAHRFAGGESQPVRPRRQCPLFTARAELLGKGRWWSARGLLDIWENRADSGYVSEYDQLSSNRRTFRNLYLLFILLIALFILFVATWIALILAQQISVPISALLVAAGEVRKGNLAHRVHVTAIDELAHAGAGFNEMMHELEANSRELESRRRFTEAILESIPTGVISLASDGRIQRVNRALHGLFPRGPDRARRAPCAICFRRRAAEIAI